MNKFKIVGIGLAAALTACASTATTPPTQGNERWMNVAEKRVDQIERFRGGIMVMGDSIAARWPVELQEEYFGHRFVNLGLSGDKTEGLAWRLRLYDLPAAEAPAALLIIGTNDLRDKDSAEEVSSSILNILASVKAQLPNTPLFVSEILPRGKNLDFREADITQINRTLHDSSRSGGFHVLSLNHVFRDAAGPTIPDKFYADTVHPSPEGYRLISDELKKELATLPAQASRR